MEPQQSLPYAGSFSSAENYVDELLEFAETSHTFQILCGGVHVLDLFTCEPSLFQASLPEEWLEYLLSCDIMRLLDLLLRDDLDALHFENEQQPPKSLLDYIRSIRSLTLRRDFLPKKQRQPKLQRSVSVGMTPKKIHEVVNFADFVDRFSENFANRQGHQITHFVDFGSGQNYLGRALASEPYNKHVVAVEGRETNVQAAKWFDKLSGLAARPKVMRNKKIWNKVIEEQGRNIVDDPEALNRAIQEATGDDTFDFRSLKDIESASTVEEGKGHVQYVSGRLDSGDLSETFAKITLRDEEDKAGSGLRLMAVSIHSCGNLSHYGIRSMIMNPNIRAVAIVGCCYNLMTEKLGPPSSSTHPYMRPTLQAVNARIVQESERRDPEGFPMSNRFSTYKGEGIRLNITARMMACQAPGNWTRGESEGFFQRHFFRAVLQRIFLDRGVVRKIRHDQPADGAASSSSGSGSCDEPETPFNMSTSPMVIGSLRKACYGSLKSYVRGAVEKLTTSTDYKQYAEVMRRKMGDLTDEEIGRYEALYLPRRKEVSVMWTLMAFSAGVVEALVVADRWTFLKEHADVVEDAWVETVFDFKESPRNLVVVGVKKEGA